MEEGTGVYANTLAIPMEIARWGLGLEGTSLVMATDRLKEGDSLETGGVCN